MDSGAGSDPEETVNVYSYTYDGPQPYNYEPELQPREQREIGRRINGLRREIELWCQENQWRVGQVSWCLCGKCDPMSTAEESMCCREVDAYWALVDTVSPRLDVQCLTQHPGFEACCLNPYVLQIVYMHFRQEHGPLQASRHEQYRYTAYRQIVRWAYGILGRHIRKPLPACVASAIRKQFPEEGGDYKGFEWPHLGGN